MRPGSENDCRNRPASPAILVVDPETAVSEAVALVVSRQAQVQRAATGMGGLWIADSLDRSIPPRMESGPGVAAPPVRYDVPVQHLEIVRWVIEFIERCYRDGTRFSEVARAAGVSRSHLCRIFKRVTGLSLSRFLTRRRLHAAKAMLRDPGTPIQQVASNLGYHDPSHFNRVFRRWEGQAPSLYRQQMVRQGGPRGQSPSPTSRRDLSGPSPA